MPSDAPFDIMGLRFRIMFSVESLKILKNRSNIPGQFCLVKKIIFVFQDKKAFLSDLFG